ncbi:cation efflux system protein, CDF family [Galdieria sulphuraria]|uniref:Cation efflux system protein, CDF family n=1 Tax=Galdieria sulphuraria TaxID=130081 RepID=M2XJW9_GALSU|nr:cation efflux system protein, CDF family [Galdieria sulphuraria]EME30412.1 cation efflux system protein, CDF family [Galdieria sulphuraria]|eukprot:XP_005706932.1 cation efflux system protein, CDF family [Galdieria sulphuraria]
MSSTVEDTKHLPYEEPPQLSSEDLETHIHLEEKNASQSFQGELRVRRAQKKLLVATVLCASFMFAEILGGYLAGSLAIMTDAAHLLSDFASFVISLVALHLSKRPGSTTMSFGYARAEVIGAFVSILLIWSLSGILLLEATRRIMKPQPVDGRLMFAVALIGLVVNLVMGLVLGHKHEHSHHRNTSRTRKSPKEEQRPLLLEHNEDMHSDVSSEHSRESSFHNQLNEQPNVNVTAAYIHVLGDAIQSLGVLFAALLIWFFPNMQIADPLCTFLFTFIVLFTTFQLIGNTLNVLMEGTPPGISLVEVYDCLCSIPGVQEVDDLHIWSVTVGKPALSAHVKASEMHHTLLMAQEILRKRFGIIVIWV